MTGRILIIDSVATNRIVLKAKLCAAFYQVEQAADATEAMAMIKRTAPDLILLGTDLPNMTGLALCRRLKLRRATSQIPVVMVVDQDTRVLRLEALVAGADETIAKPLKDNLLMARIRSLMRARETVEDLKLRDTAARVLGFAEPSAGYETPASVFFTTPTPEQGLAWRNLLKPLAPYQTRHHRLANALKNLSKCPAPDAFVVSLDADAPEGGLRFLAELRARSATRRSAVLVIMNKDDDAAWVDALDLGANDVMPHGFDAEEVSLRLAGMIKQKRLVDRLRQNVQDGLDAAVTDPLTGLHNRRYALPQLARITRQSQAMGTQFAVMVADLDHFKTINDRYGHNAGDVVLAEIARRMRETLSDADLIARIGGEEFLVVLQRTDQRKATAVASRLCEAVRNDPVYLHGRDIQIPVTVSIGVAMGGTEKSKANGKTKSRTTMTGTANDLIDVADQALYGAKADGRDQVTMGRPAH
ncbi:diguanylate cyclase [Shimia sp.]|uniref:diguanylate cyclase n=1 Tax=Shimia sp. TaxID=1954381 RepID=UPI0032999E8B